MLTINCVFVLIAVFQLVASDNGFPKRVKCASCRGVLSPLSCNGIEICMDDDEICYVEEVIDLGGEMVINAGCRKKSVCDSKGCFNDVLRQKRDIDPRFRRAAAGEQVCHHCCDTEFCNMFGCSDTQDIDNLQGSRCVVCDMVDHPSHCNIIENCGVGEYCYASLHVRGTGGDEVIKRYSTGCMKREVCDALDIQHQQQGITSRSKRSYVELYSQCCTSHLCNRDLPLVTDMPARQSQHYTCPERIATDVMAKTAKPATITAEVCEDVIDNCAEYGFDYICFGDYVPWARLNCNKFCKFCEPCEDTIAECPLYGYDYICSGSYIPWSLLNCKKFCNLCDVPAKEPTVTASIGTQSTTAATTTTTKPTTIKPTTTEEPCMDHILDCDEYGYDYICSQTYLPWAKLNCRRFCNLCESLSPLTPCKDDVDNCAEYGHDYICTGDYIPWSTLHCPVFCGLCPAGTTTPSTTPTYTTTPAITSTLPTMTQTTTTVGTTTPAITSTLPTTTTAGTTTPAIISTLPTTTTAGTTTPAIISTLPTTTTAGTTTPAIISTLPTTTTTTADTTTPAIISTLPTTTTAGTTTPAFISTLPTTTTTTAGTTTPAIISTLPTTTTTTAGTTTPAIISTLPTTTTTTAGTTTPAIISTLPTTKEETTTADTTTPAIKSTLPTTKETTTTAGTTTPAITSTLPTTKETPTTASPTIPAITSSLPTTKETPTTASTTTPAISSTKSTTTSAIVTTITNSTTGMTDTTKEQTTAPDPTTAKPDVTTHLTPTTKTTTVTTATTKTPQTTEILTTEEATTTEKLCKDTQDCSMYSTKLVCHGEFLPWALQHCQKHCGFCIDESETTTTTVTSTPSTTTTTQTTTPTTTTTTPAPTTTPRDPNCFDVANCVGVESRCGDTSEHTWLYENCRHTCQMCQEPAVCEDEIQDCATMAQYICEWGLNPELKPKCKKTCNLC